MKKVEELKTDKKRLEDTVDSLEKEKKQLKETVEDLKLKKKMEEENIKHMIKIDRERKDLEVEKEMVRLGKEKDEAIAKVKDEYRDKVENDLKQQVTNMKDMYGEILARLPNYNVNHSVKEKK
jgi:peptidoglycan hydrolase CwlO-like protein